MRRLVLFFLGGALGLGVAACQQSNGLADCNLGTTGCECIAGQCHGDLMCVAGVCVGSGDTGMGTDEASDGDDDPSGGEGGLCDEPEPIQPYPALACTPDVPCASDENCPDGHVCNTELDPPGCQLLYCGTVGSLCHLDEVCDEGLRCHEGQCNPCDLCGDLCEVDFGTSLEHCGCCDSPVPASGICDNGVATCPDGLSLCDDECVDLGSDPANCGECGNTLGAGVGCMGGQPSCSGEDDWPPLMYCDGTCIDPLYDDDNCGACGATCSAGDCGYPGVVGNTTTYCYIEIDADPGTTCTTACAEAGMGCDYFYQEAVYEGWCDVVEYQIDCNDTVPASTSCGDASCSCDLIARACRCHPVPP